MGLTSLVFSYLCVEELLYIQANSLAFSLNLIFEIAIYVEFHMTDKGTEFRCNNLLAWYHSPHKLHRNLHSFIFFCLQNIKACETILYN